jgi:hypothetical protein
MKCADTIGAWPTAYVVAEDATHVASLLLKAARQARSELRSYLAKGGDPLAYFAGHRIATEREARHAAKMVLMLVRGPRSMDE